MRAVEVKHRLPRRSNPVGDAREGTTDPIPFPVIVRVLCAYRHWRAHAGNLTEHMSFVVVDVRSSKAIRAKFTEAMTLVIADWDERVHGPAPRSYEFSWYLPANGRENF